MDAHPTYKKFGKRGASATHYCQLWRTDDHLLLVRSVGTTDEYKRFYFRDIQAFIIVKTSAYSFWIILNMIFLIGLGLLIIRSDSGATGSGWFIPFVVLLVFFMIHLARGKTCTCWVQTGINYEKLPMFSRLHYARKMMARLQPDLEKTQGVFSIDEMAAANGSTILEENPNGVEMTDTVP